MNKKLNKYVNEIIAIAGKNNVNWDIGVNMFLSNVKNCGKDDSFYYVGADGVDWAAAAAEILPLTPEEEADLINTYCADYRAHMDNVIEARKTGDYEKAVEIMVNA